MNIPWSLSTFLTGIYNECLQWCITGALGTSLTLLEVVHLIQDSTYFFFFFNRYTGKLWES